MVKCGCCGRTCHVLDVPPDAFYGCLSCRRAGLRPKEVEGTMVLKRGTTKDPKDGTLLHWEQMGGMRVKRNMGTGVYYSARNPKTGRMYFVEEDYAG